MSSAINENIPPDELSIRTFSFLLKQAYALIGLFNTSLSCLKGHTISHKPHSIH